MLNGTRSRALTLLVCGAAVIVSWGCGNGTGTGGGGGPAASGPKLDGIKAEFNVASTSPVLTNASGSDLTDVDLTLTFSEPSGQRREEKQRWAAWANGEAKKADVTVEKGKYQNLKVKGTAKRDGKAAAIDFAVGW